MSAEGWPPDRLDEERFRELMAPLFEDAPRFLARLSQGRPYGSWSELFRRGVILALDMPLGEQLELIDAHPRIGAAPATISVHSFREQGYDAEPPSPGPQRDVPERLGTATGTSAGEPRAEAERREVQAALERLNRAYEDRFGFRYVVFVAGRPRAAIVPLIEAALVADPDAERERALRDVLAIARDRAIRTGLMARQEGAVAQPAVGRLVGEQGS